jgi:putative ABC transport system ATP-binding protein
MIQLKSVHRSYKMGKENVAALDGVNLDIKEGEFVAIMGPSGSGKSTLANIIGGLDRPNSGSVNIDGEELSRMSDRELSHYRNKKIGFVFQSFNLISNYTAIENVMLPLIIAGMPRKQRKEKAYEYLKAVGLETRVEHKPTELSGGERQRVSIARALANDPRILIADEPTGNLDSRKTDEIMEILKLLNKEEKITILVITHDSNVAKQADRVLKMQDGRLSGK